MKNHKYDFLVPKNGIKYQEDVFEFCDQIFKQVNGQGVNTNCKQNKIKCYWKSKLLFAYKDETLKIKGKDKQEKEKKKKLLQNKIKEYLKLFSESNWKDIKEPKRDYLKSNIVQPSIPYTIALWTKIILKEPYFSKDDEYYYYIANPILKDKATKTPMVRGSGIKGKLAVCAAKVMYESILKDGNNLISELTKYLRIFGSGNDELKSLNALLQRLLDEKNSAHLTDETKKEIATQFIRFILLNFGGEVAKRTVDNILGSENVDAVNKIVDWIHKNMKEKEALKSQKGRLTFFPMFFNKIKLEVINRHSRARRVGEGPIYFEVVPKDDEANLILVYTPFDAVYKTKAEIKKEAEEDLEFIIKALEKLQGEGLGAKRKYGWGQFEMKEKMIIKRDQDELKTYEGWNVE